MITIRLADDADENRVFALSLDFPAPYGIDRETFGETWNQKLADSSAYVAVAEVDGAVVGYVSGYAHTAFYANGATVWIDEIFVREDLRGRGIGRNLMDGVSKWAKERGCKLVALATLGAADFYQTLGYEDSAKYFKKHL